MHLAKSWGPGRGGPGGWLIVDEPELHFDEDILVPDLAGWRRERMAVFPDAPFLTLPPDWTCEVLSPGSARFDRKRKMPIYARQGVRKAWLVDPLERTLEVFRLVEDRWLLLVRMTFRPLPRFNTPLPKCLGDLFGRHFHG